MYKRHFSIVLCSFSLVCSLVLPRAVNTQAEAVSDVLQTPCDPEAEECTFLPLIMKPATPPSAFGKSSPANGATGVATSLSLDWDDAVDATEYEYCYDMLDDDLCGGDWLSVGSISQISINGLAYDSIYYWQVRAVNNPYLTYANDGEWWNFTTVEAIPPGAFVKLSPTQTALHLYISHTLDWADSSGAIDYEYCYDMENDNLCAGDWVTTGSASQAYITGLAYDTLYFWQARAHNDGGYTYADAGVWWAFVTMTSPPGEFNKISPYHTASDQPINLTLDWESTTNVTSYEYCIDLFNNAACDMQWISTSNVTQKNLTNLAYNTTYFWQVHALNPDGETLADNNWWWSFRTMINPWVTLTSYDFEGASTPSGWQYTSTAYRPARRDCDAYPGGSYSGWMVGGGTSGAALACGANYPDSVYTYLRYGPFSLSDALAAYVKFSYRVNLGASDNFTFEVSNNVSSNYYGWYWSETQSGWQTRIVNLADVHEDGTLNYLGQSGLYIRFTFESSVAGNRPEGAYVDTIELIKCTSGICGIPPVYTSTTNTAAGQLTNLPLDWGYATGFPLFGPVKSFQTEAIQDFLQPFLQQFSGFRFGRLPQ